jgi:hypothetical protein
MKTPVDETIYSPGETKLVNTEEHSHTHYIGGPTPKTELIRSKFENQFEGTYRNELSELKMYELTFYYNILTDQSFFEEVLDMYGEILGCWCLPEGYCHGEVIVDFLTYGFEHSDVSKGDASNDDEWLVQYIDTQVSTMDSTNLPPVGVEMKARVEERVAMYYDEVSSSCFAATIENVCEGWEERLD